MNENKFSALVQRVQNGDASPEEIKLLEQWLENRAKNNLFDQLPDGEKEKIRTSVMAGIEKRMLDLKRKGGSNPPGKPLALPVRSRIINSTVYRIAASIVLLAVLSFAVWQWRAGRMESGVTSTSSIDNQVNKVLLADGSIVWLKGNSTLTYPVEFSGVERHVTLSGEALFEVAKDARHPFVVQCGDMLTTVLGTSFNIKSTRELIEVVVLTGKVSLTSPADKLGIVVLPNEKAVYNGLKKELAKGDAKQEEKLITLSGTEYDMDFDDIQVREVIERIEGKFNVKITLSDSAIGNCFIKADFTDQSLERTINMMALALGFEYEINDKTVSLTGTGCN